jgi:hypothetical protein
MKAHLEHIQRLARAHHIEDPLSSLDSFLRFLQWWWCRKFNRPLKDPLLKEYTTDELFYEFMRHYYLEPDNDPRKELEAKQVKQDEDQWIKHQLSKFQEETKKSQQGQADAVASQNNPPGNQTAMPLPPDLSTKFE